MDTHHDSLSRMKIKKMEMLMAGSSSSAGTVGTIGGRTFFVVVMFLMNTNYIIKDSYK